MKCIATPLDGAYIIEPEPVFDSRGWFARTFDAIIFQGLGLKEQWVNFNNTLTHKKGTIRGMHFQYPPYSEYKLIRCVSGGVYDVIIDLRSDSTTFMNWFHFELNASDRNQLLVPPGFAHGFQTLEDNTELLYAHSSEYVPGHEGGIRFDEPRVGIKWPLAVTLISEKDRTHEYLKQDFKGIIAAQ